MGQFAPREARAEARIQVKFVFVGNLSTQPTFKCATAMCPSDPDLYFMAHGAFW